MEISERKKKKRKTNSNYRAKLEFIQLRVGRVGEGRRDRYKAIAEKVGLSVNQFFIQAVEKFIADNKLDL